MLETLQFKTDKSIQDPPLKISSLFFDGRLVQSPLLGPPESVCPPRGNSAEQPQTLNQVKSLVVCSREAQFILVADVQERTTPLLTPRAPLEVREGVCGVGLGSQRASSRAPDFSPPASGIVVPAWHSGSRHQPAPVQLPPPGMALVQTSSLPWPPLSLVKNRADCGTKW